MTELTPSCAKCPYQWPERLCNTEDGKGPIDGAQPFGSRVQY